MRQVTAILIGAGLRGAGVYASYALEYPNELKIVAVAEPDADRRNQVAALHHISEEMQFLNYEDILEKPCMADCAFVCTQDRMHFIPVTKALQKGYHVLCEKPMSPIKDEIIKMGAMADQYKRILSICHVLRYSPFFTKIKELLQEDKIGRLITVQQIESVGYWHQAHSFVRGNWRNDKETSPMILQKCCHDMDILLWLVDSNCTKVSSFGALTYFKEENAPEQSPRYCMDGCIHRDCCPFYAPRFYLEHPMAEIGDFTKALTVEPTRENILEALKKGPYGRCVFHCDNTVVDHQVVNLEFENQVNVSFTMCAFTNHCERVINIMGTKGQLRGNMEEGSIEYVDFVTGNCDRIKLNTPVKGHSGSDASMMRDFVRLVEAEGKMERKTSAAIAVDSHLAALAAEQSRIEGCCIDFTEYKKSL